MSKSTLFEINITFDAGVPVDTDTVQRAMLRALGTKAFGIAGSARVVARPLNSISEENAELARPGVCAARGCEARVVRKAFFCGKHFQKLPSRMQALLKKAKAGVVFEGEAADALTVVMLACVGALAVAEGRGSTRDENNAMSAMKLGVEDAHV